MNFVTNIFKKYGHKDGAKNEPERYTSMASVNEPESCPERQPLPQNKPRLSILQSFDPLFNQERQESDYEEALDIEFYDSRAVVEANKESTEVGASDFEAADIISTITPKNNLLITIEPTDCKKNDSKLNTFSKENLLNVTIEESKTLTSSSFTQESVASISSCHDSIENFETSSLNEKSGLPNCNEVHSGIKHSTEHRQLKESADNVIDLNKSDEIPNPVTEILDSVPETEDQISESDLNKSNQVVRTTTHAASPETPEIVDPVNSLQNIDLNKTFEANNSGNDLNKTVEIADGNVADLNKFDQVVNQVSEISDLVPETESEKGESGLNKSNQTGGSTKTDAELLPDAPKITECELANHIHIDPVNSPRNVDLNQAFEVSDNVSDLNKTVEIVDGNVVELNKSDRIVNQISEIIDLIPETESEKRESGLNKSNQTVGSTKADADLLPEAPKITECELANHIHIDPVNSLRNIDLNKTLEASSSGNDLNKTVEIVDGKVVDLNKSDQIVNQVNETFDSVPETESEKRESGLNKSNQTVGSTKTDAELPEASKFTERELANHIHIDPVNSPRKVDSKQSFEVADNVSDLNKSVEIVDGNVVDLKKSDHIANPVREILASVRETKSEIGKSDFNKSNQAVTSTTNSESQESTKIIDCELENNLHIDSVNSSQNSSQNSNLNQTFEVSDSVNNLNKTVEIADGICKDSGFASPAQTPICQNTTEFAAITIALNCSEQNNSNASSEFADHKQRDSGIHTPTTEVELDILEVVDSPAKDAKVNSSFVNNNSSLGDSISEKEVNTSGEIKYNMADMADKVSSQQQEISDLKLQLNASQQTIASFELQIRQKEEIIIKTQAEIHKIEQSYGQEIKLLKEQLAEKSLLIDKDSTSEMAQQIEKLKAREAKILSELNARNNDQLNYKKIMDEYEKTISERFADFQKLKDEHETVTKHLANLEFSFSDVHSKYERSKAVIEGYKGNEATLRYNLEVAEQTTRHHEEKYESLKAHAKAQIDKSNKEFIQMRDRYEAELSKLHAIIKRLEIKVGALEVSLEQKVQECIALSALCDEVTGKRV